MPSDIVTEPLRLGVVIVTFNSSDVILDCLESLLASVGVSLSIQIVDNQSPDETVNVLRRWAAGRLERAPTADLPFPLPVAPKPIALPRTVSEADAAPAGPGGHRVALLENGSNAGFAGGVNIGLAELARCPGIDRFWILNPDTVVAPAAARAFAARPVPGEGFALMGGRVLYLDRPDMIQIDGGTINWRTGITGNLNQFRDPDRTPAPAEEEIGFVMGGNMVASRAFYERAGPMREDYFLYYEEVDWALRRGEMPLVYCPEGVVYHRAGTAIGSGTHSRDASPFALYFKHRARMMFMQRFFPRARLSPWAWTFGKATQMLLQGYPRGAFAVIAGAAGWPPPSGVRAKLSDQVLARLWPGLRANRPARVPLETGTD